MVDQWDLTESVFVNSPISRISAACEKFDFVPISNFDLQVWREVFLESMVLENTLITSDLVAMFPKINNGGLLYRMTRDWPQYNPKWIDPGNFDLLLMLFL